VSDASDVSDAVFRWSSIYLHRFYPEFYGTYKGKRRPAAEQVTKRNSDAINSTVKFLL